MQTDTVNIYEQIDTIILRLSDLSRLGWRTLDAEILDELSGDLESLNIRTGQLLEWIEDEIQKQEKLFMR